MFILQPIFFVFRNYKTIIINLAIAAACCSLRVECWKFGVIDMLPKKPFLFMTDIFYLLIQYLQINSFISSNMTSQGLHVIQPAAVYFKDFHCLCYILIHVGPTTLLKKHNNITLKYKNITVPTQLCQHNWQFYTRPTIFIVHFA